LRKHVIIDFEINLSDHLPVKIVCRIGVDINSHNIAVTANASPNFKTKFASLDWNKEACSLYYDLTRVKMQNIYEQIVELQRITTERTQFSNTANNVLFNNLDNNKSEFNIFCTGSIEQLYSNIVDVLSLCSSEAVSCS